MEYIKNFLSKTDLSMAENIILAVITTVLCSMMLPFIWKIIKLLCKTIYKKLKQFIKYLIRLKKGILTAREMIDIQERLEKGQKISKRKLVIYNKEIGLLKNAVKDLNLSDLHIPIPPQIHKF